MVIYPLLNETLIWFQTIHVYDYINKYIQFISPILGFFFKKFIKFTIVCYWKFGENFQNFSKISRILHLKKRIPNIFNFFLKQFFSRKKKPLPLYPNFWPLNSWTQYTLTILCKNSNDQVDKLGKKIILLVQTK
jgi:hypothetical protein